MAKSATATVTAWVLETKARVLAVRNESAQRIVEIAQTPMAEGGRMRVDTGFLRASLVAFTGDGGMPAARANPGGAFAYDAGQVSLVIAGADLDDRLTFAYTANYARPREYGANGQSPDAFVRMAAQQWQRVVGEVCVEARARAGK